MRKPITIGGFTLMLSLTGDYYVAPGSVRIYDVGEAVRVAKMYSRIMGGIQP